MLPFLGDSKSQRASKLHNWFKSFGDFSEWVDLPIGEGASAPAACAAGLFLNIQASPYCVLLSNGPIVVISSYISIGFYQ